MTDAAPRSAKPRSALLGDTPSRNYARKLSQFNSFAEPELRQMIAGMGLRPGMRVLDAGCGTGEALGWLFDAVGPSGSVVGIDLSMDHVKAARRFACPGIEVMAGDIMAAPLPRASFDCIWCVNTINHFRDPLGAVKELMALLRPRGRMALGQSSLLPDMFFAWDSRLERVTNEAVRRYYRDRYGLDERDLCSVRALLGVLRAAQLGNVSARTVLIERISPVDAATERYLVDTQFEATWGERLRPYMDADDHAMLAALCDPRHARFAVRRPDFHFLQSFTLVWGEIEAAPRAARRVRRPSA